MATLAGSIISSKWILTAAHCCQTSGFTDGPEKLQLLVGTYYDHSCEFMNANCNRLESNEFREYGPYWYVTYRQKFYLTISNL